MTFAVCSEPANVSLSAKRGNSLCRPTTDGRNERSSRRRAVCQQLSKRSISSRPPPWLGAATSMLGRTWNCSQLVPGHEATPQGAFSYRLRRVRAHCGRLPYGHLRPKSVRPQRRAQSALLCGPHSLSLLKPQQLEANHPDKAAHRSADLPAVRPSVNTPVVSTVKLTRPM